LPVPPQLAAAGDAAATNRKNIMRYVKFMLYKNQQLMKIQQH